MKNRERGKLADSLGDLGNRQTDEVTQFDQTGLDGVDLLEPFERLIDGQNIERRLGGSDLDLLERLRVGHLARSCNGDSGTCGGPTPRSSFRRRRRRSFKAPFLSELGRRTLEMIDRSVADAD
jgi:hypothetical protein